MPVASDLEKIFKTSKIQKKTKKKKKKFKKKIFFQKFLGENFFRFFQIKVVYNRSYHFLYELWLLCTTGLTIFYMNYDCYVQQVLPFFIRIMIFVSRKNSKKNEKIKSFFQNLHIEPTLGFLFNHGIFQKHESNETKNIFHNSIKTRQS